MIIYYDKLTKDILYTENEQMYPQLPGGTTAEKAAFLAEKNIGLISVPYELGEKVYDFELRFDTEEKFIGLEPKSQGTEGL